MMKIQRITESGLEVVERPTKGCWIDIINPSHEEVRELAEEADLDLEFVTAVLKPDEIPRVEKVDHTLYILARIPHFQGAGAKTPYETLPLGIILTNDQVITICKHEHGLQHELEHKRRNGLSTTRTPSILSMAHFHRGNRIQMTIWKFGRI